MDLLHNRANNSSKDLLEKRFIGHILKEESLELDQNQKSLMASRGFSTSEFYTDRNFRVISHNKLQYTHPRILRFVDMRKRQTKTGSVNKKSHPVHNKPLYGMVNNVLRRLQFEYTSKMKAMLLKDYNIEV